MPIIKCKMCGGDMELSADKTFGTCEYCGSTMTLPKVSDEQRAAAFNRGNHFRRIGEFDKALAVYERIVREDETDAEAHWCCALCRFGIEYVEDPTTYEWIPTCHRASFDSFLEDVDYKAAMEHSDGITRRQYMKDAAKIAEVQRGILATSQNEDPFDVFICYKESDADGNRTRDSLMAQDIYYQLMEQGHRVFFSRITLEDKAGTQYEPYIFAALNSAKVMVVVGTKPEHLNAVWVKNEWSRFLALMRKDRNKIILPCYRDMDPYDLPEQLSVLQSYDMSKIGFIQDLIRGISKVLDADKKPEPVKETVVVQQTGGTNANALLKRGYMALEDADWEQADKFFEKVLNVDAENAEAYLGKALAQVKVKTLDELVRARLEKTRDAQWTLKELSPDTEHIQRMQQQYEIQVFLPRDQIARMYAYQLTYQTCFPDRTKQRQQEERKWAEHKWLSRALRFASGEFGNKLKKAYEGLLAQMDNRIALAEKEQNEQRNLLTKKYREHLAKTDEEVKKLSVEAAKKRDARYQEGLKALQSGNSEKQLIEANNLFRSLGDYKDSVLLAEQCSNEAKYQKNLQILHNSNSVAAVIDAANAFIALGDYKDSASLVEQCNSRKQELLDEANAAQKRKEKAQRRNLRLKTIKRLLTVIVIFAVVLAVASVFDWAYSMHRAEAELEQDRMRVNLAGKEFSAYDDWTGRLLNKYYRYFTLLFNEDGSVDVYHLYSDGPKDSNDEFEFLGTFRFSLTRKDTSTFYLVLQDCKYQFEIKLNDDDIPTRLVYEEP